MKAHVKKLSSQPQETVLLYCMEAERQQRVIQILEGCGAKIVTAGEQDSGQTLGALFSLPEHPVNPALPPQPEAVQEAMFFAGFSEARLNTVLARLKNAGLSVPYKAVLTANNQGWPMAQLLGEITREHKIMQKLDQLSTLRRQLLRYDPTKLPETHRKEALEALGKAQTILRRPTGISEETMELAIAAMQRAVALAMADNVN